MNKITEQKFTNLVGIITYGYKLTIDPVYVAKKIMNLFEIEVEKEYKIGDVVYPRDIISAIPKMNCLPKVDCLKSGDIGKKLRRIKWDLVRRNK